MRAAARQQDRALSSWLAEAAQAQLRSETLPRDQILTSDPDDVRLLTDAAGLSMRVLAY